jgi:hypothetical protein
MRAEVDEASFVRSAAGRKEDIGHAGFGPAGIVSLHSKHEGVGQVGAFERVMGGAGRIADKNLNLSLADPLFARQEVQFARRKEADIDAPEFCRPLLEGG